MWIGQNAVRRVFGRRQLSLFQIQPASGCSSLITTLASCFCTDLGLRQCSQNPFETWSGLLRFTNMTRTFKGTLDYILYTSNSLAPTAVLELPDELEVSVPCQARPTHTSTAQQTSAAQRTVVLLVTCTAASMSLYANVNLFTAMS